MNVLRCQYSIRQFRSEDAEQCLNLFLDTVRRVNSRDYTPTQIDAWADPSVDREPWFHRFNGSFGFVAEFRDSIVGFADLTENGYLDRLFVSADHQRQGVATLLMDAIEAAALGRGMASIHTQASITAKPFFLSRSFVVVTAQTIECRGVQMNNFVMEREFAGRNDGAMGPG